MRDKKSLIYSIDAMRTIAIFGVICLHSGPFFGIGGIYDYVAFFINHSFRFSIPFFFIVSGYFFSKKLSKEEANISQTWLAYIKRLFLIVLFWSIFYVIANSISFSPSFDFTITPVSFYDILFEGGKFHLWFVVSLIWASSILVIFVKYDKINTLFIFASLLYIFGLSMQSYQVVFYDFSIHNSYTRNGPFFSTLFFCLGYITYPKNTYNKKPLLMTILGFLLIFVEFYILRLYYGDPPLGNYFLGSIPYAYGIFQLCLKHKSMGSALIYKIGPCTLGIYVLHVFYINLLLPLKDHLNIFVYSFTYPFLIFFISLLTTIALSRVPFVKRFIF